MEIFKTFGIDPIIIIAQVVNFLVILFILKKFLYKPLFAIFEKRKQLAEESVKNAEESKKAFEKAAEEEKALIKKAQATANQIIKDARDQAATMTKDAEEATKKKTDRMLAEAKAQIERETKDAEKQLSTYVSKLSVDILKKSLTNVFSDKDQEVIVQKAVKEIEKRPTN